MIVQTKLMQLLFKQNIENTNPRFEENFRRSILFMSSVLLPQLFQNVLNFELHYKLAFISKSSYYACVLLEFIRYLTEGQNAFM
jgi:hypothetical protein